MTDPRWAVLDPANGFETFDNADDARRSFDTVVDRLRDADGWHPEAESAALYHLERVAYLRLEELDALGDDGDPAFEGVVVEHRTTPEDLDRMAGLKPEPPCGSHPTDIYQPYVGCDLCGHCSWCGQVGPAFVSAVPDVGWLCGGCRRPDSSGPVLISAAAAAAHDERNALQAPSDADVLDCAADACGVERPRLAEALAAQTKAASWADIDPASKPAHAFDGLRVLPDEHDTPEALMMAIGRAMQRMEHSACCEAFGAIYGTELMRLAGPHSRCIVPGFGLGELLDQDFDEMRRKVADLGIATPPDEA